jgi:hypothetical protein
MEMLVKPFEFDILSAKGTMEGKHFVPGVSRI